jgi:hypothetical protein
VSLLDDGLAESFVDKMIPNSRRLRSFPQHKGTKSAKTIITGFAFFDSLRCHIRQSSDKKTGERKMTPIHLSGFSQTGAL